MKLCTILFFPHLFQEHTEMSNKTLPLPLSLVLMSALLPASASSDEVVPANEDEATQQIVRMIEESVRVEARNG